MFFCHVYILKYQALVHGVDDSFHIANYCLENVNYLSYKLSNNLRFMYRNESKTIALKNLRNLI